MTRNRRDTGLKNTHTTVSPCKLNMKIVLDNAQEAVIVINQEGTLVYANQKTAEISGYEIPELTGANLQNLGLFPGRDLIHSKKYTPPDLKWQSNGLSEIQLTRKDGKKVWVEFHANQVKQNGNICVTGFFHDINERKQMEEALRDSEEKFRNLFENAKDAVILVDVQTGTIVDVNPAGCKLLGLPKDKIIGMHQSQIHPPELVEEYKKVFLEHVEKGLVVSEDAVIQRADGSQVPCEISASVAKSGG